jgi:integrase
MASIKFEKGVGYRIQYCFTIKAGPHKGTRLRPSQTVKLKRKNKANDEIVKGVVEQKEKEFVPIVAGLKPLAPTWAEFLKEYYAEKARNTTIKTAIETLKDLGNFCGIQRVDGFTGPAINRYIRHRRDMGATDNVVRAFLSDVGAAMTLAFQRDYVSHHPFRTKQVTVPKAAQPRDRFLTREEFAKFLWAMRKQPKALRPHARHFAYHCIFIVHTGLRITEYVTARRQDLLADRLTVSGKGKFGVPKRRTVPLSFQAKWALEHLKTGTEGRIFTGGSKDHWANKYKRWFKRAGIPDVTPHTLRRTFGSWIVMAGTPLNAVQQIMGHSSITTTIKHYSHLEPSYLQKATSKLRYKV